jgi:hypothetical protein
MHSLRCVKARLGRLSKLHQQSSGSKLNKPNKLLHKKITGQSKNGADITNEGAREKGGARKRSQQKRSAPAPTSGGPGRHVATLCSGVQPFWLGETVGNTWKKSEKLKWFDILEELDNGDTVHKCWRPKAKVKHRTDCDQFFCFEVALIESQDKPDNWTLLAKEKQRLIELQNEHSWYVRVGL